MNEMPIATAAKEVAIRQATAFPFLEDVCMGRTRPSARALESHRRLSAAANRRRTDRTEISNCWRTGMCYPFALKHRRSSLPVHAVQVSAAYQMISLQNGIMRGTIAVCAILVLLIGTADAEQCPPGALGVSRTLVVDPTEH